MSLLSFFNSSSNRRDAFILLILVIAGSVLRFYQLGFPSLWNNEDYLAISVKAILETGLPLFPTEIIYPRALPMSYITAVFVKLFGFSEFTLRLPSAIFSTLTILLTYIFARQTINRHTALIAAGLVAVFFWEVIMAHTGRMYAMFSFMVLLTFVLIHAAEIEGKRKLRFLVFISLFLVASLHSIALALIPMLIVFVPYFINKGRKPWILLIYLLFFSLSFMVSNQFSKMNYQQWNELTTQNIEQPVSEPADKKETRVDTLISQAAPLLQENIVLTDKNKAYWVGVATIIITLTLAFVVAVKLRIFLAFLILMTVALALQQIIIAGCIWLLFLFTGHWLRVKYYGTLSYISLAVLITGAATWVLFELQTSEFTINNAVHASKILLAYPPLFLRLIFETFPWITLVFITTSIGIAISTSKSKKISGSTLILLLFILPLFAMCIHPLALERLYDRYIYFLSPYFLIIIAFGLSSAYLIILKTWKNNQKVAVILSVSVLLLTTLSGGFSLTRSIAKANTVHGINADMYDRWTRTYYYHPDHQGPAQFVASQYQEGDLVIAMDILAYYAYFPIVDYQLTVSEKRDAEGWIGATTINTAGKLVSVFDDFQYRRIWIVTSGLHIRRHENDKEFISIMNTIFKYAGEPKYLGADGKSVVYCISCDAIESENNKPGSVF